MTYVYNYHNCIDPFVVVRGLYRVRYYHVNTYYKIDKAVIFDLRCNNILIRSKQAGSPLESNNFIDPFHKIKINMGDSHVYTNINAMEAILPQNQNGPSIH